MLEGYDRVVIATGVRPRSVSFDGADHPKVVGYLDVLTGRTVPGARVAIIGAGGIGFDVAQFLIEAPHARLEDEPAHWRAEWGVDLDYTTRRGGLVEPRPCAPLREVWLLQRSAGRPGARLGKTTGWVHRASLKTKGVHMHGGVEYKRVDDAGLHVRIDGGSRVLEVDHVVVCAGQKPERALAHALAGRPHVHLIGGADVAAELDAKRAIDQGSRLAASF